VSGLLRLRLRVRGDILDYWLAPLAGTLVDAVGADRLYGTDRVYVRTPTCGVMGPYRGEGFDPPDDPAALAAVGAEGHPPFVQTLLLVGRAARDAETTMLLGAVPPARGERSSAAWIERVLYEREFGPPQDDRVLDVKWMTHKERDEENERAATV